MVKKDQFEIRSLIKYFLLSFLILLFLTISTLYLIEQRTRKLDFSALQSKEQDIVQLESDQISRQMQLVVADLFFLRNAYKLELQNPKNYSDIAADWQEFSTQQKRYDQIRFINTSGDEIIRINFDGNSAYTVPPADLQNKYDRYYFSETISLSENEFYISPIDYNVENNILETPYKPVFRISIPVYDEQGDVLGIIILNYLAQDMLDVFREIALDNVGDVDLLNEDGYWISSQDESLLFNFMFADLQNNTFQNKYANEWNSIVNNDGQIITANGLFTYSEFDLYDSLAAYRQDLNLDKIKSSNWRWYIVSTISHNDNNKSLFFDNPLEILASVFQKNWFSIVLLAILSGFISIFASYNIRSFNTMKYYSEYDSLTNVYNRRTGLEKIHKLFSVNDQRQHHASICFIDINGLKQINDVLGHKIGDDMILTTIQIIKSSIRDDDFITRHGGDEFLIVHKNATVDQAEEIWKRIVASIDEFNQTKQKPYIISVSHGIIQLNSTEKQQVEAIILLADARMYEEKRKIKENLNVIA
jgi:diguanylate cyclase (GGDEF)-like protein